MGLTSDFLKGFQPALEAVPLPERLEEDYERVSCLSRNGGDGVWLVRRRADGERLVLRAARDGALREEFDVMSRLPEELRGRTPRAEAFFEVDGAEYLVRTYLPGRSLAEVWEPGEGREDEAIKLGASLCRLLDRLQERFDLSGAVELTVEAGRPDTITEEKLAALRRGGVTRISVNPQTMEDKVLAAIGRRHTAGDIRRAMELVDRTGFDHVNMDLIAGLPEDTPEGFRRTLDQVTGFGTDNVTIHTLSLKKGSRITLEGTRIPTVEEVSTMLDYADPALRRSGFAPYYLYRQKYMSGSFENVGWCRSGGTGWYNIYIMEELHSILSLGAGGSTKMVDPVRNRIERVFNLKYPQEYIQRPEKILANQEAFRAFYRGKL